MRVYDQGGKSMFRIRAQLWKTYFVLGSVALVLYAFRPSAWIETGLFFAYGCVATVAIFWGIRHYRPRPTLAWISLLRACVSAAISLGVLLVFQLVLTQAFTSSGITTGVVTLTLEGLEGQIAKSLTLAQLTDNKLKELPFRFKYFQEIAGDVVLPAGFVPRRVIVEVEPRGGEKLQNSFDWPA